MSNESRVGFTLLELIIVLFLVMLILSLVVIVFAHTLTSSRLSATAREMSATIRYARSLAQIRGEQQTITIDMDLRRYGIEGREGKDIPPDITVRVIDPLSGEVRKGKYPIIFHVPGGVEGGTIVLTVREKSVSIQVDPVVGSVVIR
jgi:type II secretory pathway pseudopilin PulG